MKHKHYECIVAWADGAEIEINTSDGWVYIERPSWFDEYEYRIKPEPKPDVVLATNIGISEGYVDCSSLLKKNIKLTFCGETGDLKNAEVIK